MAGLLAPGLKEGLTVSSIFHAAALVGFVVFSSGKIKPPKKQYVVDLSIGSSSFSAGATPAVAAQSDFVPFNEDIEDDLMVPVKDKKPEPKNSPAETGADLSSRKALEKPTDKASSGSSLGGAAALVGVGSGVSNFPFPFYIESVRKKIAVNWDAKYWRDQALARRAQVTFAINRDGSLVAPQLQEGSGDSYFDSTCLRSVMIAAPYQPLPQDFEADRLRIVFDFEISP